jgi:phage terminase small subunit
MANLPAISLNDRQAEFVRHVLMGIAPHDAALKAGYSESAANVHRLLSATSVQVALEIGLRRKLHGELVPLAFNVLHKLITTGESERIQLDAAKIILDRGGFIPVKQSVAEEGEPEPEQMTTQQLHAKVEQLERELAERATPIAPSEDPTSW